jgi:peptidoglycan L-alanyl-D-glutamate endopeptidase CwlK
MDRTEYWLSTLNPAIAWTAEQFIDQGRRFNQLPIVITSGLRSTSDQRVLLSQGRTTTLRSKHVVGLAFDVDMYGWNRDAVPVWVWSEIGPLGESFGLTWGGRWKSFRDVGHFEL